MRKINARATSGSNDDEDDEFEWVAPVDRPHLSSSDDSPELDADSWGNWSPPPSKENRSSSGVSSNAGDNPLPDVIHHTLLSIFEIEHLLTALRATDIATVDVSEKFSSPNTFMVFCTCSQPSQMRECADYLVLALKERKLQECGVVGAKLGAEGYDCNDWMIVDCGNAIVQIMDATTRESLQLEERWNNPDSDQDVVDALGGESNSFKKRKDEETGGLLFDDPTIDRYVEARPIPDSYDVGLEEAHMEKMVRKYVHKAKAKKMKLKKIKAGKLRQKNKVVMK